MSLLPDDLARQFANGVLPWDRSLQIHINEFFTNYTLHDSHWITLRVDCGWEDAAIAAIRFDPIWNQSVAPAAARCDDWPLLFLRFSCVNNIEMSGFSDIGGLQRGISSASVARKSDEQVCTEITDHYGATIRMTHWPLVNALVLTNDGEIVPLEAKTA